MVDKIEFQDVAAEIFEEFADFASDALIEQSLGFDYENQQPNKRDQLKQMIRIEYENHVHENARVGDYMLIGEYQKFDWEPEPNNTTVEHEGVDLTVKRVVIDAAQAAITLHVVVS